MPELTGRREAGRQGGREGVRGQCFGDFVDLQPTMTDTVSWVEINI